MPSKYCTDCSVKLGFFRKKVQCTLCRCHYCTGCFNKVKDNQRELQNKLLKMIGENCLPCVVLYFEGIKREQLYLLGIRHLTKYLTHNNIPHAGCKEKYHLIDLIMEFAYQHGFVSGADVEEGVVHDSRIEQLRQAELLRQQQEGLSLSNQTQDEIVSSVNLESTDTENTNPLLTDSVDTTHIINVEEINNENVVYDLNTINTIEGNTIEGTMISDANSSAILPLNTTNIEDLVTDAADIDGNTDIENINIDEDNTEDTDSTYSFANQQYHENNIKSAKNQWKSVDDIKSESDIAMLTVLELKQILTANFIDYRGCCEKQELIEKCKMLYSSEKQNEEDLLKNSSSYDKDICKICMDNVINCVLLDCGHLVVCTKCGKRLAECPVCRALVVRVVHIFRV